MSRFDFTGAILSGFKLRALREDLELSKLQRKEYEATAGHRAQQRALELELGELEKRRLSTATMLDTVQTEQLKERFPEELAGLQADTKLRKAQARGARADARKSRADADVAEATKPSRIGQAKSQAVISGQAALGAQLNNLEHVGALLQRGNKEFQPQDYLNLAQAFGSPEGASAETLAMLLEEEIRGMQTEYKENTTLTKAAKENDRYVQMGQTIDLLQRLGPEGAAALKGQGIFPDAVLDAVSQGGGGSLSPEQKSALSGIDKALGTTYEELARVEGQLTPYRAQIAAGKPPKNRWIGKDDKDDYEALQRSLTELQGSRKFLTEERSRLLGRRTTESASSVASVLDQFEIDTKAAKPEELLDYLKANGVKATLAEVKAYLKSRSDFATN